MNHVTAALAAIVVITPITTAATLYDEALSGDLSGDRFAPTALSLSPGVNTLFGVMDGRDQETNIFDRDFFSISIPAGFQLSRIDLADYQSEDFIAFVAFVPGPVFTPNPDGIDPSQLTGWTLFGTFDVGEDILADMALNTNGFTPPLTGSTYSFWAQQTGEFTTWTANFIVEPIPTPGPVALAALAGLAAARRRR
jgi:hypothetical protein